MKVVLVDLLQFVSIYFHLLFENVTFYFVVTQIDLYDHYME